MLRCWHLVSWLINSTSVLALTNFGTTRLQLTQENYKDTKLLLHECYGHTSVAFSSRSKLQSPNFSRVFKWGREPPWPIHDSKFTIPLGATQTVTKFISDCKHERPIMNNLVIHHLRLSSLSLWVRSARSYLVAASITSVFKFPFNVLWKEYGKDLSTFCWSCRYVQAQSHQENYQIWLWSSFRLPWMTPLVQGSASWKRKHNLSKQ